MTDQEVLRNEFLRTFHILSYSHNRWSVWQDFIFLSAASISNSVDKINYKKREKEYLRIIRKYSANEQRLFPKLLANVVLSLDKNPEQDYLGSIFMELKLNNDSAGQFFTPYNICQMTAKITMGDIKSQIKEKNSISINDPACGAGAMIIAAINEARNQLKEIGLNYQDYLFVVAQDIDLIVGLMCYIQISLLGVSGIVKIGNSLTEPFSFSEKISEGHWVTPMYYLKGHKKRRGF